MRGKRWNWWRPLDLFSYISSHTNLRDICDERYDENRRLFYVGAPLNHPLSNMWMVKILPLTQLYISSISCGPSCLSQTFKSSKTASPFKDTSVRCEGCWVCSVQLLTVNSLILRPFLKISRCVVRHTNTKWDHNDLAAGKTLVQFLDEAKTLTARCSSPLPSCWNKLKVTTRWMLLPIVMKSCLTVSLLR